MNPLTLASSSASTGQQAPGMPAPTPNSYTGHSRTPRARPAIPRSDPHQRVPALYQFPTTPVKLGTGLNSGRNMLVLRGNEREPVTRVPLIIERGRSERHRGAQYPHPDSVLPAGLTLTQIVQLYPRHAWGTMLRVFMAESFQADRIWRLTPVDMRNTKSLTRPWNYIQAAMGREKDKMVFEETGVKRDPIKREKQSVSGENLSEDKSGDDIGAEASGSTSTAAGADRGVLTEHDLTTAQLQEIAKIAQRRCQEIQQAIIAHKPGSKEKCLTRWQERLHRWADEVDGAYAKDTGQHLQTRNPVQMLRIVWKFVNKQEQNETASEYDARATRCSWDLFVRECQSFVKELEVELAEVSNGGEDTTEVDMAEG